MLPDMYNLAVEIRHWPSKAQWLLYKVRQESNDTECVARQLATL